MAIPQRTIRTTTANTVKVRNLNPQTKAQAASARAESMAERFARMKKEKNTVPLSQQPTQYLDPMATQSKGGAATGIVDSMKFIGKDS